MSDTNKEWTISNKAYLELRGLRDFSLDTWDTVDEDKDPVTYAYFSGRVTALEQTLDMFYPENWRELDIYVEDSVPSEGE
tara:strand:+ start:41 stop:280 length:240 start_codon:yes stop_codon:yes gene_type:complete